MGRRLQSVTREWPDERKETMADSTLAPASAEDFERITLPHLDAVARFALSLTRSRADADDLVQETYLRACRGWRTFRSDSDPRRWLFAICRNAFLRTLRREHRTMESDSGDLDALPAVLGHAQAVRQGLGDVFDLVDVRPAIEQAIDRLPELHHSVLTLVDLEDHSYEEAAAILGLPIGTVRSRLFRARRMIQETLLAHAQDAGLARSRQPLPNPSQPEAQRMARPVGFPTDCETVVRALWDYLDRELDDDDMSAIDAHLADCERCRAHAVFERQLMDEIRKLRALQGQPDTLRTRVLDMLRRARYADPERA